MKTFPKNILKETEKAVLVLVDNGGFSSEFWLPKSQITITETEIVDNTDWLFDKKLSENKSLRDGRGSLIYHSSFDEEPWRRKW